MDEQTRPDALPPDDELAEEFGALLARSGLMHVMEAVQESGDPQFLAKMQETMDVLKRALDAEGPRVAGTPASDVEEVLLPMRV